MNIILNADDFGDSESINQSILELHKLGIISSTSVIAKSKYYDMAVEISKANPQLGIGVHLCLDGPFNIGSDYRTILNKKTKQFFNKQNIIKKLRRFAVDGNELYKEYYLQIEKVMDSGIKITHLDHHHHLHLYFPVLKAMIKAGNKFRIPFIRTQKIVLHQNKNLLNKWYRNLHQFYVKKRINAVDAYFDPYIQNKSEYDKCYTRLRILFEKNLKTVEIVLHPRTMNDPETRFFTSIKTLELLANQVIISYNDLKL